MPEIRTTNLAFLAHLSRHDGRQSWASKSKRLVQNDGDEARAQKEQSLAGCKFHFRCGTTETLTCATDTHSHTLYPAGILLVLMVHYTQRV